MWIGYYNYTVIATYAGLACGVAGIFSAQRGNTFLAVIFLMAAGVLDMFDGKIARRRKRSEDECNFGIQIDSLCDLVSFGVLPVVIGYSLGLKGIWLCVLFIIYVLNAQIRLAYFNVDEMSRQRKTDGARKYYRGLPVTTGALIFPFIYTFTAPFSDTFARVIYGIMLGVVAVMFILNVKIRKPGKGSAALFLAIGLVMTVCMIVFRAKSML